MRSRQHQYSDTEATRLLRERGINPTAQRVLITRMFFEQREHLAAEDVYRMVNKAGRGVSKATVYNTLGLLAQKGVIREVMANPDRTVYDPNVTPHHHFYEEASGELTDVSAADVSLTHLPPLPADTELRGVEVIIRIRKKET